MVFLVFGAVCSNRLIKEPVVALGFRSLAKAKEPTPLFPGAAKDFPLPGVSPTRTPLSSCRIIIAKNRIEGPGLQ